MSLDDLRDHYKASRQSNDLQLKLNGATYRVPYRFSRFGNTITLKNEGARHSELDELNDKYDLSFGSNVRPFTFSLNKKKRWELTKELTKDMPYFAKDDIDVRLYETRNRNQKKANCIAVHKSKGEPIGVKKTFANLASIKKAQDLETIAKNTKTPAQTSSEAAAKQPRISKKNRKCSKPGLNKNKSSPYNEVIVVDVEDDLNDNDTSYIQYEVEYAPKTDVLKYGYQYEGIKNKVTKAKKFVNKEIFDEYDVEISDVEDEYVEENTSRPNPLVNAVDLEDLIDQQILKAVEMESLKEYKNQMKQLEEESSALHIDKKDRKVYMENRSDSDSDENKANKQTSAIRKSAKPIAINLDVSNQGLDSHSLKAAYGLKYAEAHLCWPRMFSINLDEEIRDRLLKKYSTSNDFDIVMWLRFEQTNKPVEYGITQFKVSILTNLNCESIALENVNPCAVLSVGTLVEKSLEFMLSLPIEMYYRKEFSKPWGRVKTNNLVESLPNIGGEKNVKTLEEIKLKLVQDSLEKLKQPSSSNHSLPPPPPAQIDRSNSIEVVKHDEVIDEASENKLKNKLATLFEKQSYECILCFDEKSSLDDCVVIKSCAHCICESCMRAFIDSHLFNSHLNAGSLQCPGCDTNLELALMINYASNANFMEIFIRQTIERVVFVLNEYKWCPSPFCGNIIHVDFNSNPYGTVSCTCGFKMCLRCNNAPHFPAKCSQVANYYKELRMNHDFDTPEDDECVSMGKRCPMCSTYIEKNGGCNHMYCVTCKKYFCWNCLVDWDKHSNVIGQCKQAKQGEVRIEFKRDRKPLKTKANQVRYEDSLNHRKKRTYKSKQELAKASKRLINTLSDEKKDEAKKYLTSMIECLNEMHFVCEHAYVLISDNSLEREAVNRIRNLINSIEVNIWLIESIFNNGSGSGALDELKRLHEKSLRCIRMLKAIKTNE